METVKRQDKKINGKGKHPFCDLICHHLFCASDHTTTQKKMKRKCSITRCCRVRGIWNANLEKWKRQRKWLSGIRLCLVGSMKSFLLSFSLFFLPLSRTITSFSSSCAVILYYDWQPAQSTKTMYKLKYFFIYYCQMQQKKKESRKRKDAGRGG